MSVSACACVFLTKGGISKHISVVAPAAAAVSVLQREAASRDDDRFSSSSVDMKKDLLRRVKVMLIYLGILWLCIVRR